MSSPGAPLEERDSLVRGVAAPLAARCLARIAAEGGALPARTRRTLAELAGRVDALLRGDLADFDRGHFTSLGESTADVARRPGVREPALFEAVACADAAIDGLLDAPDGELGEEGAVSLANLAGAVRAATSVEALAHEVARRVVEHDLHQRVLREELRWALRRFVSAVGMAKLGQGLVGVALGTDDDLSSLAPVACTEDLLVGARVQARYLPVEWTVTDGREAFVLASRLLALGREVGRADVAAHVARSFESLVAALEHLREYGSVERPDGCLVPFPRDALLLAYGRDPSPALEAKMFAAADRLNPPAVARGLRAAHGRPA